MGTNATVSTAPLKQVEPKTSADQLLKANELKSLLNEADETEQSGRSLMEPAAVAKKKKGRPSNAEKAAREAQAAPAAQAAPEPQIPAFDCTPAATLTFSMLSAWVARYTEEPRMAMYPEEIQLLGQSWGLVANQYLPQWLAAHANLATAIVITGQVGMRLNSTAQMLIKEKQRAREMHAAPLRAGSAEARPGEMTQ